MPQLSYFLRIILGLDEAERAVDEVGAKGERAVGRHLSPQFPNFPPTVDLYLGQCIEIIHGQADDFNWGKQKTLLHACREYLHCRQ